MTPRIQGMKEITNKLDFTKVQNLCVLKAHYQASGNNLKNERKHLQIIYLIREYIKNSYKSTTTKNNDKRLY
jgi:hypothetical protein